MHFITYVGPRRGWTADEADNEEEGEKDTEEPGREGVTVGVGVVGAGERAVCCALWRRRIFCASLHMRQRWRQQEGDRERGQEWVREGGESERQLHNNVLTNMQITCKIRYIDNDNKRRERGRQ